MRYGVLDTKTNEYGFFNRAIQIATEIQAKAFGEPCGPKDGSGLSGEWLEGLGKDAEMKSAASVCFKRGVLEVVCWNSERDTLIGQINRFIG